MGFHFKCLKLSPKTGRGSWLCPGCSDSGENVTIKIKKEEEEELMEAETQRIVDEPPPTLEDETAVIVPSEEPKSESQAEKPEIKKEEIEPDTKTDLETEPTKKKAGKLKYLCLSLPKVPYILYCTVIPSLWRTLHRQR